jgi:hypothetical protein
MKTLVVSEINRPYLEIQEIKQDDGSLLPGAKYWSAVDFVTDASRDDIIGHHNRIQLQVADDLSEIWEFVEATVMLCPQPKEKKRYILTYDGVHRVCKNDMKLRFEMYDGVLEARESGRMYTIHQKNDVEYHATMWSRPANYDDLSSGDLYECLDACNKHAQDIRNSKKLDVEKELKGCTYEDESDS